MTALNDVILELDTRATTDDNLIFHVVFGEFNNGAGDLTFTDTEAELPRDDLSALAVERYTALRWAMFDENGWTDGLGGVTERPDE